MHKRLLKKRQKPAQSQIPQAAQVYRAEGRAHEMCRCTSERTAGSALRKKSQAAARRPSERGLQKAEEKLSFRPAYASRCFS